MYRILLIDDHAVVRKGLRAIIEEQFPDEAMVDEAGTGHEGIEKLRKQSADIVVLDIALPDMSGLDVLKRIHAEWPGLPVLILSIYSEDQYGVRMLRAGASGYLAKTSAPENLAAALKRILAGGRYITPLMGDLLASRFRGDYEGDPEETLSDREYQVFGMIASGCTVTEIASELALSVKTISTHRKHVLTKMNMKTNADIVRYAMATGVVHQR